MTSAAVKSRTTNLGLGLLNFNFPNWGDDANRNMSIIDTAFAVFGYTVRGNWEFNTDYFVGDLVADVDEGKLYRALMDHTSAASGTFSAYRAANPSDWESVETTVSFVGEWETATVYTTNQFLVDGARYGVVAANFESDATYDADVAAGNIITLIDLTNFGVLADFNDAPDLGKIITGNGTAWVAAAPEVVAPIVPSGTRMLFQQTAAPTLWTKDTTHNNKALRLVNGTVGTGGTVSFTDALASKSVVGSNQSIALTLAQTPSHSHNVNIWAGTANVDHSHFFSANSGTVSSDHTHGFSGSGSTGNQGGHTHSQDANSSGSPGSGNIASVGAAPVSDSLSSNAAGTHSHTVSVSGTTGGFSANHVHGVSGQTGGFNTNHQHFVSGTSDARGSDATHTHIFTGTPIDLAVQYVDCIICVKD